MGCISRVAFIRRLLKIRISEEIRRHIEIRTFQFLSVAPVRRGHLRFFLNVFTESSSKVYLLIRRCSKYAP